MKTARSLLLFSLASFVAADDPFHFELNSGVKTQQETEARNADELYYTTSGGVASVHSIQSIWQYLIVSRSVQDPYSIQRAGENGPVLIQDFHLVCFSLVVRSL